MPAHRQVVTCLRGGGPCSDFCSCEHCTLAVCSVCGAYEGSLTIDCPGEKVTYDRQQEVYTTALEYTDALGWHQDGRTVTEKIMAGVNARFETELRATNSPPAPAGGAA